MQEITEITGNNRCLYCRHVGMIQTTELTSTKRWPHRQMGQEVKNYFVCKLSGRTITLDRAWNDFLCRAWEPISERQQQDKDPVDQAIDILRGYCCKVTYCSNCRFGTPGGNCTLTETPPCDWETGKRKEKEPET